LAFGSEWTVLGCIDPNKIIIIFINVIITIIIVIITIIIVISKSTDLCKMLMFD
jgi:hypothetical protein